MRHRWRAFLPFTSLCSCRYEFLDKIRIAGREILDSAPDLLAAPEVQPIAAFMDRVESIPMIKIYLHSTHRIVRPINNPQAPFR